jgi:hypothetical protein
MRPSWRESSCGRAKWKILHSTTVLVFSAESDDSSSITVRPRFTKIRITKFRSHGLLLWKPVASDWLVARTRTSSSEICNILLHSSSPELCYLCEKFGFIQQISRDGCTGFGDTLLHATQLKSVLYLVSFLVKLGLRWDIQQPITTAGWGQPSAEAFSCSLAAVRDVCIGAVQCCHVLPFSHCESGLNHLTSAVRYIWQQLRVRLCSEHR